MNKKQVKMENQENKFRIFINGFLYNTVQTREDAMWTLGAKYGGMDYNRMADNGQIRYKKNSVHISIK